MFNFAIVLPLTLFDPYKELFFYYFPETRSVFFRLSNPVDSTYSQLLHCVVSPSFATLRLIFPSLSFHDFLLDLLGYSYSLVLKCRFGFSVKRNKAVEMQRPKGLDVGIKTARFVY